MSLLMRTKKQNLLLSILELEEADYGAKSVELEQMYRRLVAGRTQFEEVLANILDSLMQISSLDLSLNHYSEILQKVSDSVSGATELIHSASDEAESIARMVSVQHEELTNTIIEISEESNAVYQRIDEGQQELTDTKRLSDSTISASKEMQQDMNQLSEIISQMNNVIAGINSISYQTNLLALNASIEAARAGEAGKGFAVVASEIGKLAGQSAEAATNTRELIQKSIGEVESGNGIARTTAEAFYAVNNGIKKVVELNGIVREECENQAQAVNEINEGIEVISGVVESNSAAAQESSATSQELAAHAQTLQAMLTQFTFSDRT